MIKTNLYGAFLFFILLQINSWITATMDTEILSKHNLLKSSKDFFVDMILDSPVSTANCIFIGSCEIHCFNGHSDSVVNDVEKVMTNDCQEWALIIFNYTFPENKLPKLFAQGLKQIKILRIYFSVITSIEEEAFKAHNLTEIELNELQLKFLNDKTLVGLKSLTKLKIVQKKNLIENVPEKFMEPIRSSIEELVIQTGLESPKNVSNSYFDLKNLHRVDLSYNNFQELHDAHLLHQLQAVRFLDLSNAKISFLSESIFEEMSLNLEILDLSHNLLQTISIDIFGKKPNFVRINFNNNPWNCDCDLRNFFLNMSISEKDIENVTCETPEHFKGKLIKDISGCSSEIEESVLPSLLPTTESTPSTPTTTELGPKNDSQIVTLKCSNPKNVLKNVDILQPEGVFLLTRVGISAVKIDLVVTPPGISLFSQFYDYEMIWFSEVTKDFHKMGINYKDYGLGCVGNFSKTMKVNDLVVDKTYTFCLKRSAKEKISPLNCKSYYLGGPTGNTNFIKDIWISDDMKTATITSIFIGVFLFLTVGAMLVYCLIKRKPSLLKGKSKRIVCTKKNSEDIIILPKKSSIFSVGRENSSPSNSLILNKRQSTSNRRESAVTLDIYESFVNPNMYETIENIQFYSSDYSLHKNSGRRPSIKRNSNDPLPAIPNEYEESKDNLYGVINKNRIY